MTTKALIFNIQKYSIHDGPGIRTIVFLKGCPLRCAWCANPESQNNSPDLLFYPEHCIGCLQCSGVCETGAIHERDKKLLFDRSLCTSCLKCVDVCSAQARKKSGELMSVEEIFQEVIKDKVFYETSGGGVTFSGGEPLMWPEFIADLSQQLKANEINTAVETCGQFPESALPVVLEWIDHVLFDIKLIDEEKHIKYCGGSNREILSNFKKIVTAMPIVIRIPIIPGINDQLYDLNLTVNFLKPYEAQIKHIDLLPYHNLGISKFNALGRPYTLNSVCPPSLEHMKKIQDFFQKNGFMDKVTVMGTD